MPIRVNIPGVGIMEFADGTPQSEIDRQSRAHYEGVTNKLVGKSGTPLDEPGPAPAPPRAPTSAGEAFYEMGSTDLLDQTVRGVPRLAGQALAGAAAAVKTPQALGAMMWGQPGDAAKAFEPEYDKQTQLNPAAWLMDAPFGTGQDVLARGKSLRSGVPMAEARRGVQAYQDRLREEHPVASKAGEIIIGDGGSLALGRGPIVKATQPKRAALREAADEVIDSGVYAARENWDAVPTYMKNRVSDSFSRWFKGVLEKGPATASHFGKKAGGAALEGAYIAALNDDNPKTAAMFAAGAQAVGSGSIFLMENMFGKKWFGWAAAAIAAHSLYQAAAPGEQNIFEAKDWTVQKAMAVLGLGVTAAVLGGGRLNPKMADQWPRLMDSITSVPRGSLQGLMNTMFAAKEEGDRITPKVIEMMYKAPTAFSDNQMVSLGRAVKSGDRKKIQAEIDRLMRDEQFSKRVDEF